VTDKNLQAAKPKTGKEKWAKTTGKRIRWEQKPMRKHENTTGRKLRTEKQDLLAPNQRMTDDYPDPE
jgi:hypothetical protein